MVSPGVFSNGQKSQLIEVCRYLHHFGFLKAFISSSELAEITLKNQILSGTPSGERLMHLAIYNHCSRARAIVHAHPPIAVAWSIAHPELQELPSRSISEVILSVGKIPIVPSLGAF